MLKFGVVGGFCYFGWLGLLYFFADVFEFHYLISMVFSWLLVNSGGWFANRRWTFGSSAPKAGNELLRYLAVSALSFFLTVAVIAILVDGFEIHYMMASAVTALVMSVFNFFAHRHLSFAQDR